MKRIHLFLLIPILFASCFGSKQKLNFKFTSENVNMNIVTFDKKIKLVAPAFDSMFYYDFVETKQGLQLMGSKFFQSKFYSYNFDTNISKTVSYNTNLNSVSEFLYVNKDSIFFIYGARSDVDYQDSLFFLGNDKGDIIRYYSLKGAPVFNLQNLEYQNSDYAVNFWPNYEGKSIAGDKLILHFTSEAPQLGHLAFKGLPIAGFIDLKTGKYHLVDITYPNLIYEKQFYHRSAKDIISTFTGDNQLLFGFKYTPTMIKYNPETKNKSYIKTKSSIIDTIYAASKASDVPKGFKFDLPYPQYYNIQYDKYRKLYFRFIMYPKKNEFSRNVFSVIVADSSLKTIAEGFLPNIYTHKLFFTKDYIYYCSGKNKNGKLEFIGCKLKFEKRTNQYLINKLKENTEDKRQNASTKPLTVYVEKYGKVKQKNYTVTFLALNGTCQGTSTTILNHFSGNIEKYNKYNNFLFIQTMQPKKTVNILSTEFNLSPTKFKNVIIDSTLAYSSFLGGDIGALPRVIKVRNNKIVKDTVFQIEEPSYVNFQNFLISAGKEQKQMIEKK